MLCITCESLCVQASRPTRPPKASVQSSLVFAVVSSLQLSIAWSPDAFSLVVATRPLHLAEQSPFAHSGKEGDIYIYIFILREVTVSDSDLKKGHTENFHGIHRIVSWVTQPQLV